MFSQKSGFESNEETINQKQLEEELDVTTSSSENLANEPQRESLKAMLFGSRKAVISAIYYLHSMGHIHADDWTPLEPSPSNPKEVMSILTRKITVH